MAAQALMKRGKRSVAKYFKDECSRQGGQQHISDLLDYLLDPQKPLDDFEGIDWCRWVISGGMTFDEFSKEVRRYDNAVTCGLVWTANFVAYRCRTCGISPCMSLCSDCFQAGNHLGHDFNMFRSQAGGACDCGDISVMKPAGFCPRHGPNQAKQQATVPQDLLAIPEVIMPRLIFRLVQHLRDNCRPDMLDTYLVAMNDAEQYVTFLHSLSDMGAAMRHVITDAVTNAQVYTNLTQGGTEASTNPYVHLSQANYQAALETLKCPPVPEAFKEAEGLASPLNHTTLLEELLFWTVKFEFPQKIVTFLLSILPDDNYKEAFTQAFIQHYSRISIALVNSVDRQTISNRVVHVSVQLLSPEVLAKKMVEEYNLLYIMLMSLEYMMGMILTDSELNDPSQNYHMVVDCGKDSLKEHCYWPIVSDLINVLSHKPISYKFMSDNRLLQFWFQLVSFFQGMNLNQRELSQHVEYEPDTYYAAFSAELEICSSPMWSLLVHCNSQETASYSRAVINTVVECLQDWFDAINAKPFSKPNPGQVSFHLPLHRYLSVFLSQGLKTGSVELADVLPSHDFLQMLMIHPLQLQVVFHEIFCSMWVRNGLQIKGQAMTYIQCHFCNSMVDADLYLLQVCATRLDPDYFVKTVLERFHVTNLLTFAPRDKRPRGYLDTEQEAPMLEGSLIQLAMLICTRTNLGMNEEELTRLEMLTLLCMSDRTHSQLMDLMPEKCGLTGQAKDFEPTLKQVADYKAPNFEAGGAMQQGMYIPKGFIWESDYDPLYVALRAMHRKDFQQSMDRFTTYVRQNNLYSGSGSPWPPFRMPGPTHMAYSGLRRMLHCRTMHGLIFVLLHKALNEPQTSDAVIYYTVYLLEMAVSLPVASTGLAKQCEIPTTPRDKHLSEWFPSDSILSNARHVIRDVAVTVEVSMETEDSPMSTATSSSSTQTGGVSLHSTSSLLNTFLPASSVIAGTAPIMSSVGAGIQATAQAQAPPAGGVGGGGGGGSIPGVLSVLPPPPGGSAAEDIINAVQEMLDQATAHLHTPGTNNNTTSTSTGTSTSPKYRSQGMSTESPTQWTTSNVSVNQSILSLLLKLHSKLSTKPNSYIPESIRGTSAMDTESRIGDGPFFIAKILDKLCRLSMENAKIVEEYYENNLPKKEEKSGKQEVLDREERRRRAQERQRKLMEKFATKQKQFMETQFIDTGDADFDDEGDAASSETNMVVEQTYDCVICNQTTPSTQDKPFGLVTLLQASSTLGQRRHSAETLVLPVSDTPPRHHSTTCSIETEKRLRLLLRHFDESSVLQSMNIGWDGGVVASTCGHYVHLDCHASYMESLIAQQLQVSKGEYWCPLCRQLANTALPILPDEGAAVVRPVPKADRDLVLNIADTMAARQFTRGSYSLTRAMGRVMEDLTNSTYPKYKSYSKNQSGENVLLFVCSVARTNLEMELLQRGGSPCLPHSTARRSCTVPLMHVLGMHTKILMTKAHTDLWSKLTGVPITSEQSSSVQVYKEETPLLLKDPSAVLLQLVLSMPHVIDKAQYGCLVQALYNMVYIQALIVMGSKFSEEERIAWKAKAKQESMTSLGGLLGHVIQYLGAGSLYDEGTPVDPHVPAICQSVWSPQSVECQLQEFCIPFLRTAALLNNHLYSHQLPTHQHLDAEIEFSLLCNYLGLMTTQADCGGNATSFSRPSSSTTSFSRPSSSTSMFGSASHFSSAAGLASSATAVHWYCLQPDILLRGWCQQLVTFINKQPSTSRTLLLTNPTWQPPRLFSLPQLYDKIFQHYRRVPCRTCNLVPKEHALCLVCAQVLCFKDSCCKQQNVFECVQHSIDCGAGTGIYLIVSSSVIVVIRGQRATLWGSVYLDDHGEEDRDLKRGKPLYLSTERYALLQQQWITHNFDHACKRWIFHQDRL